MGLVLDASSAASGSEWSGIVGAILQPVGRSCEGDAAKLLACLSSGCTDRGGKRRAKVFQALSGQASWVPFCNLLVVAVRVMQLRAWQVSRQGALFWGSESCHGW